MFKRDNTPFLLAGLALVLSFLLMIAFHGGGNSSDVAAWVQAVGSVAAVWAAYHMGSTQSRRAEMQNLERDIELAYGAYYVLQFARDSAHRLVVGYQPGAEWQRRLGGLYTDIESARAAIENYDLARVPAARLVKAMIRVADLLRKLEVYRSSSHIFGNHRAKLDDLFHQIEKERSTAFFVIEHMRSRLT